jgi:hypothetical protein
MNRIVSFDPRDLTFITTANNLYVNFVEPFIYFCKISNPGCKIEIWVDDLNAVSKINDPDVRIHQLPNTHHVATYRYILTPTWETNYYYITDIDIMHTEFVQPFHLMLMQETGLPFSNIIRNKKGQYTRMSGLHFVKSQWYEDTKNIRPRIEPKGQDEEMLYQIANSIYDLGKVTRGLANRPVQGIHCSVGRNPRDKQSWELTSQRSAYFVDAILKRGTFNPWFEEKVCRPLIGEDTFDKMRKRRKI